jgi:hypothetical protein
MSNTPRYQGFIDPPYTRTFIDQISGNALDLTGCVSASFTLTMINATTGLAVLGAGVWTVANQTTNKGQASYQWTTSDMATIGFWEIYTTVKLPSEPSPRAFDPELIQILPGTVGAGAAPPGVLPNSNPSATLPFLNIRDFGGIGDNATDNTTPIFNARAAARAMGGACICYGPGTFLSGNQDISNDAGIYHVGSGKKATIVKLKNGANTDLFSAQTSLIDLTGASSGRSSGTLYNFGFANMTLDGNKANQSSGPSYPLRFYGYSYILENVEIRNGYSGNWISDWGGGNTFVTDSMEAQIINVKTHDSNGMGIEFNGPHDSQFVNLISFKEASHCLHLCPGAAGAMFKNLHAWYPGNQYQDANRPVTTYDYDTFSRANQSGLGTSTSGKTYTVTTSSGTQTASIVSNQGKFTGTGFPTNAFYILGSSTLSDGQYYIESTQGGQSTDIVYLVWRYQDSSNYYKVSLYNSIMTLQKVVAGSTSQLGSTASFNVGASTLYSVRVQMVGTSIKVKWWLTGQIEPPTWNITATDSTFASGKYGFAAYIETSGNPVCQNYYVQSVYTQSGKVGLLLEANGCQFDGCSVESSDTAQVVLLGSNTVWEGGSVYDFTASYSSGIQIGQQASETAYAGQILASGGLTNGYAPLHNRISTYVQDCQGDHGALWLDNDGGFNVFDLSINQDLKGIDKTGSLSLQSVLRESYDDGTHFPNTTSGTLLLDSPVQIQKSGTIYSGSGAPSNSNGANGDFYFRTDTPGTANQRLYVKSSGSWTGIL